MRQGWYGERHRHYLAAKGIKTTVKSHYFSHSPVRSKLDELSKKNVEYFNEISSVPGGMSYSESKEVTAEMAQDYETLGVSPAQAKLMAIGDLRKSQKAFEQTVMQSDDPDEYFSKKYFMFKTEESNTPSDNPGLFGWRHKNDTIKTNHRLETVNRKKRVWMDKIEKGIEEGKYSHKLPDEFLEDVVKPLEEQYVNGHITREQLDQEWESKGQFKVDQCSKTASAFNWAKPPEQQNKAVEPQSNVSAFDWAKPNNQSNQPKEASQW